MTAAARGRRTLARVPSWWGVVALVVALAGVGGAGRVLADPAPSLAPRPTSVPVASTALVCPAPLAADTKLSTAVTLASAALPDLPPGSPTTGAAGVGALGTGAFQPQRTLTEPGTADGFRVVGKSVGPVLAVGTGGLAPGLAADQLTRGSSGQRRGLAVQPCGPPVSRAWFIGGGSAVGRATQLFLSNVEDEPALVDVVLYGAGGPIDAPGARGVVVAPRSRVALSVARLAPGQTVVAMHVLAREGLVSPAVLDNLVSGRDPRGLEYLPVTDARRRVVLPAVLGGAGARQLVLLAPADDATITVSMLTADGAIAPAGLDALTVPQGKVTVVPIDKVTAQQGVGLVLTSSTPLVAGVHMVFAGTYADTSDIAGTPRLDAPAAVTGMFATQSNALVLAAPGAAARLRMTTYAVGGTASGSTPVTGEVTVAAGSTTTVRVTVPAGASWAWVLLEPDPFAGAVYAVRRSSEANASGDLVTTAPVRPLRPVAEIPAAVYQVGADTG